MNHVSLHSQQTAVDLNSSAAQHLHSVSSTPLVSCKRCLYDETTSAIRFNADGVCNYCELYDQMDREYPIGDAGEKILRNWAERIRADGRRKKFDVIVGVSGGCDSSMLIYKAVELGLRPLAVHYDNTWDSKIAVENIHNVLKKLNVELFTHVVDNEVYNDMLRAFMLAGVPDIDAPTDIGLATTMYMAAAKHGVRYMFQGHAFRTEGVAPLGWCYMDARYIQSVVKEYGNYNKHHLKTFPNLWLPKFLKWIAVNRIMQLRPLYWYDYQKEEAKKFLAKEFGWQWYGGHHLENRWAHFVHNYFFPKRYGIDQRLNGYSALVRSGQMSRAEGLDHMSKPAPCDPEIIQMVKKRLNFTDEDLKRLMAQPRKTYRDFKTYKPTFERLRPFFWLMYKMQIMPKSFYVKYTSKSQI